MKKSIISIVVFLTILILSSFRGIEKGTSWKINQGKLQTQNINSDNTAKEYWNHLKKLLPKELLDTYVVSLKLYSDGEGEDLGGMQSLDDYNKTWEIDLDTIDFNLKSTDSIHILDYTHTVIHEFGHLLTLNESQVKFDPEDYDESKPGYYTDEGYANYETYLGAFVKEFWEGNLFDEWQAINNIKSNKKREKRIEEFYLDYKNEFLTDYAATSPEEDIAEAWTFFILDNKQQDHTIKTRKINFFYQFPELVKYRNHIRNNLKFIPRNYSSNYVNDIYEQEN